MTKFQFKRVKGSRHYLPWANWEVGDYVIGKYIESDTDQYGNPNYILEVIETSLTEDSKGNAIEDGKNLCLNSNGSLNYRMEDIELNTILKVEYTGKTTLEKGKFKGKECHTVEVMVADGTDVKVEEADLPDAVEEEEDYDL